ncbi:MAG: pilus assembly protein PilZ, partial [Treponema sp.]|nr:pilus assembly protein PilZ [Treponema sp.]
MGVLTSQKITVYYERFKGIEVTFTREIIQVTGLLTRQVHLKCVSDFWPCVIYSSSFQGAKIVANIKSGLIEKLRQANNSVSLRYCFKNVDSGNPVTFFVAARSVGYAPYGGSNDVAMFTLQFTQRPPDDLIEIMGRMLDANVNSAKRREERILITPDSQRKLNILSKESAVFIQKVPRRCILRDISFSGAKLIMMGVSKFLVDREAALRIDFQDPRESFLLKGKFLRSENVEGRKELIALAMQFDESVVPMGYKMRINDYIGSIRTGDLPASVQTEAPPGRPAAVSAKAGAAPAAPEAGSAAAGTMPAAPGADPAPAE